MLPTFEIIAFSCSKEFQLHVVLASTTLECIIAKHLKKRNLFYPQKNVQVHLNISYKINFLSLHYSNYNYLIRKKKFKKIKRFNE